MLSSHVERPEEESFDSTRVSLSEEYGRNTRPMHLYAGEFQVLISRKSSTARSHIGIHAMQRIDLGRYI